MINQGATPAPNRKRFLRKVLPSLVLAAGLVTVVLLRINFTEFARAFSAMNVWPLLGAFLLRLTAVVLRSVRWERLGVAHKGATTLDYLSATANGFLIGLAVPGLCEFTRAYVIKRRAHAPFGSVLSVLVVERVLDTLFLLVAVFFALLFVPGMRRLTVAVVAVTVALVMGTAVLVLCVVLRDRSVRGLKRTLSRVSPRVARRVAGFFESFTEGLHRLGELRVRRILGILGLTVVFWLSHAAFVFLVFRGFGSNLAALGFHVAFLTAATEYFGMIVRLTPAGLGQYQIVIVVALAAFGISESLGASVSLVLHGIRLLATISLGLPFLYREHLGLSKLAAEQAIAGQGPASFGASTAE